MKPKQRLQAIEEKYIDIKKFDVNVEMETVRSLTVALMKQLSKDCYKYYLLQSEGFANCKGIDQILVHMQRWVNVLEVVSEQFVRMDGTRDGRLAVLVNRTHDFGEKFAHNRRLVRNWTENEETDKKKATKRRINRLFDESERICRAAKYRPDIKPDSLLNSMPAPGQIL